MMVEALLAATCRHQQKHYGSNVTRGCQYGTGSVSTHGLACCPASAAAICTVEQTARLLCPMQFMLAEVLSSTRAAAMSLLTHLAQIRHLEGVTLTSVHLKLQSSVPAGQCEASKYRTCDRVRVVMSKKHTVFAVHRCKVFPARHYSCGMQEKQFCTF
eukprot:GHRR01032101.1.p1 GENE.GHRR01032101.1~~GHRR01032101.1.p1  ORF type:complete len:158 (-),score=29.36 GHRR01032101.1:343-816(-)